MPVNLGACTKEPVYIDHPGEQENVVFVGRGY